ncbi:hypothetical protein BH23BAC1_BH23BAC1_31020 [soil metagenome]
MEKFYRKSFGILTILMVFFHLNCFSSVLEDKAEVLRFTLINASTNEELFEIKDGSVINLTEIRTKHINIRAYTKPVETGSVVFRLRGAKNLNHIENVEPYALYLNDRLNFFKWKPPIGEYTLKATPYSQPRGKGEEGISYSISFTIISDAIVTGFVLVDSDNNKDIMEITEGLEIDISKLPTMQINIRANTEPEKVGSVKLSIKDLVGDNFFSHIENAVPYALFSDHRGNYYGRLAENGHFLVEATPYEQVEGRGKKGITSGIKFKFKNGLDGSVAEFMRGEDDLTDFAVYPNPGTSALNFFLNNSETGEVRIQIFDLMGNEVYDQIKSVKKGESKVVIDVTDFAKKNYIIKFRSDHQTRNIRWIKE